MQDLNYYIVINIKMRAAIIAAVLCACVQMTLATPIPTDEDASVSESDAVNYLRNFGYLEPPNKLSGNLMSVEDLKKSIRQFQGFASLPMTGDLDSETLKMMGKRRCGNNDFGGTTNARKKRYALQGTKWPKKTLTYNFVKYTTDLHPQQTRQAVAEALKHWEDASGLTFVLISDQAKADIKISFESGSHGDGDPFDGRGKTLAHAFFPYPGSDIGGDAHFDNDEKWLMKPSRDGTSLVIAGAHEFGHSLGLSHSDVKDSLMAPFYNPSFKGLDEDDIKAIQSLYGEPKPKHKVTTTTTKPSRKTKPTRAPYPPKHTTTTTVKPTYSKCNGRFDAITQVHNTKTLAFAGKMYWRLNDESMDEGYPKSIEDDWGVKGPIDAALTHNRITYLFKGRYVYRFTYSSRPRKYGRGGALPIGSVFKGAPNNTDTAFVWSGNDKIYFMKGEQYWRYNPTVRQVDAGYPRPLAIWKGLPKTVDTALQWNGKTYFFSNGFYWKFDDEKIKTVEHLQMPYPRRSDEWWLGCRDNTLMSSYDAELKHNKNGPGGHASTTTGGVVFTFVTALVAVMTSMAV